MFSYISQIDGLLSKADNLLNKTQDQNPFCPSREIMDLLPMQTVPEIHPPP